MGSDGVGAVGIRIESDVRFGLKRQAQKGGSDKLISKSWYDETNHQFML